MDTKESSAIEETAKTAEQTLKGVEANACIEDTKDTKDTMGTMNNEFHEPEKVNPVWEYFKKYRGTITITDPNLM